MYSVPTRTSCNGLGRKGAVHVAVQSERLDVFISAGLSLSVVLSTFIRLRASALLLLPAFRFHFVVWSYFTFHWNSREARFVELWLAASFAGNCCHYQLSVSFFWFKDLCFYLAEIGNHDRVFFNECRCVLFINMCNCILFYCSSAVVPRLFNSSAFPLIRQWHVAIIRSEILRNLLLSPHCLLLPVYLFSCCCHN